MIALSAASVSVTTIRIPTSQPPGPPPATRQEGPGFDGLDADGDGGVTLDEFRRAADGVRYGGGDAPSGSGAQGAGFGYAGQIASLRSLNVGFDAGSELERALAAIERAGARPDPTPPEGYLLDGAAPTEAEEGLADKLYAAVDVSGEQYDDAVDDVFSIADADGDGVMSRDEFERVQASLRAEELMRQNLEMQERIRTQMLESPVLEAQVVEGYAVAQTATGFSAVSFQSVSLSIG